ncbi:DUF4229 domain-containing protein [Nocardia paucivorans]|uniref:DUF4229 domain-containing protein n=1 Tax=Nocardia paucivorans TaxID=114259 RepID=UPI000317373F|nr:DUF4229 domain-containing protein [Nocardia paucivorans]
MSSNDPTRPEDADAAAPKPGASVGRRLARNLALYTLARLVLVAVVAAVIVVAARAVSVQVPLVVAVLFAIVIAMPLSLVLFKGLRARVNEDIAVVDERRRRDKEQLRARLRGEVDGSDASDGDV